MDKKFNKVKVDIFGQSYTINADVPPGYIKELANYVNAKMDEIARTNSKYNVSQIAILAALNIADEYHQVKNMKMDNDVLVEKTHNLITMLDEGLIGELLTFAKKT